MTYVTCRLTAKHRDQLRNPTLGNRVWATFTLHLLPFYRRLKTVRIARKKYFVYCFNNSQHISALHHKTRTNCSNFNSYCPWILCLYNILQLAMINVSFSPASNFEVSWHECLVIIYVLFRNQRHQHWAKPNPGISGLKNRPKGSKTRNK